MYLKVNVGEMDNIDPILDVLDGWREVRFLRAQVSPTNETTITFTGPPTDLAGALVTIERWVDLVWGNYRMDY